MLLLSTVLLAGCGTGGGGGPPLPPEWRGRDLREPGWANATIQPGETFALEAQWGTGQKVEWDWFVLEPIFVHFQVVRRDGTQWRVLQAGDAQEQADPPGGLTVPQAGLHQVDWLNEYSQAVTVAYHAPPGMAARVYPPGQGPGCLFLLQSQLAC